jgi:hypothetical protein
MATIQILNLQSEKFQEIQNLTEIEFNQIKGGDHPGMGPYDPVSDRSVSDFSSCIATLGGPLNANLFGLIYCLITTN